MILCFLCDLLFLEVVTSSFSPVESTVQADMNEEDIENLDIDIPTADQTLQLLQVLFIHFTISYGLVIILLQGRGE
jgi:hypothetical protein